MKDFRSLRFFSAAAALGLACAEPPPPPKDLKGTLSTVAGTGTAGLGADGKPAAQTPLYLPQDLTFGPDALPYILDWNNHRIRRIDAGGKVETVAGTGELGDGPEGPALKSRFNHPTHLIFDGTGKMIVAAWHNSRVKRIDLTAGTLEDICGTGKRAFGGDGGPALTADLDLPAAVALDAAGNLFISDQANQRIRKVDGKGNIATVVGKGTSGYSGDGGPALQAEINSPKGQAAEPAGRIALDAAGNLYLADSGNHAIRKIDAKGIITTLAGTGSPGYAGDGAEATKAQLDTPTDVEIGPDATVYIADTGNSCVRAISTDGVIRTVAGTCGQRGFAGDGEAAVAAKLDRPYGIALDRTGALYIADTHNHRIRKVHP
jgi:sugar lactone lactonase YvrE